MMKINKGETITVNGKRYIVDDVHQKKGDYPTFHIVAHLDQKPKEKVAWEHTHTETRD